MAVISVEKLEKFYRVHRKEPGLWGSVKSLVRRRYEEVKAVDGISLEINEGELVGFIGPNGAGKTTTLKCLAGLLYPTGGKVQVLGFNPQQRRPEFQKQFTLVMGQKNQLWWDLPPLETFRLNQAIYEIPEDTYQATLTELGGLLQLGSIINTQVRKLSLGERMKCELVAALLHRPQVLFLDEPTIGLDVVMQKVMRDFIQEYNQRFKATIVLTSHYMEDVKRLCKRVVIIHHGRIIFDGQLANVINQYAREKIIKLTFGQEFDQRKLAEIAEVASYQFPQATIKVPREEAVKRAAQILEEFPVADVTIEELSIEAVIRSLYEDTKLLAVS